MKKLSYVLAVIIMSSNISACSSQQVVGGAVGVAKVPFQVAGKVVGVAGKVAGTAAGSIVGGAVGGPIGSMIGGAVGGAATSLLIDIID